MSKKDIWKEKDGSGWVYIYILFGIIVYGLFIVMMEPLEDVLYNVGVSVGVPSNELNFLHFTFVKLALFALITFVFWGFIQLQKPNIEI